MLLFPPAPPAHGTLLVLASARAGVEVAPGLPVRLPGSSRVLATLAGRVPGAPDQRSLVAVDVAPGHYAGILAGARSIPADIVITAGQVTPVLLAVDAGGLLPAGVYVGHDGVNLGLSELGGKLTPLPDFRLSDQDGRSLDRAALLGRPVVLAAFHTTCHETCPLYTGMLLQLRQRMGERVRIVEVTTDPVQDTGPVLAAYGRRVGADWTFATGSPGDVADFWANFGVTLNAGDSHDSLVVLADEHGFQRAAWRGVPDVGGTLPPELFSSLSAAGLGEVRARGEGWSAQSLADALDTLGGFGGDRQTEAGGKPAPDFTLTGFDGRRVAMTELRGRPLVINFYASWCPPCAAELPLVAQASAEHPDVQFLLVDWFNDDPGRAHQLIERAHATTALAAVDYEGTVGRRFGVSGLPTTVFVRPDGTVDAIVRAQLDQATLAGHLAQLGAR